MGELLKNILSLRDDIKKLDDEGNEKAIEYCELLIEIADNKEELENISSQKKILEDDIWAFKLKKGFLFTLPIGVTLSCLYFAYLIFSYWSNLSVGNVLFTIIGTPSFAMGIAGMSASFIMHSKKFGNLLMKLFPKFKELNDNLNSLIIKGDLTEKNIEKLQNSNDEILNFIDNNVQVIESKKEELQKLENNYFNNILDNHSVETTYTLSESGKKRTRTIGNTRN